MSGNLYLDADDLRVEGGPNGWSIKQLSTGLVIEISFRHDAPRYEEEQEFLHDLLNLAEDTIKWSDARNDRREELYDALEDRRINRKTYERFMSALNAPATDQSI